MTEILKTTERPGYRIDAWPFIAALIGGPLLVTLVSFWVFLIPFYAVIFGGSVYLLFGLPLGLIYLRRHAGKPREIMRLALWVSGGVALPFCIILLLTSGPEVIPLAIFLMGSSLLFAALWSVTSAMIYDRLRSETSRHPILESLAP